MGSLLLPFALSAPGKANVFWQGRVRWHDDGTVRGGVVPTAQWTCQRLKRTHFNTIAMALIEAQLTVFVIRTDWVYCVFCADM